jgi:hypothetical protein
MGLGRTIRSRYGFFLVNYSGMNAEASRFTGRSRRDRQETIPLVLRSLRAQQPRSPRPMPKHPTTIIANVAPYILSLKAEVLRRKR